MNHWIVIPVFNEAASIAEVVSKARRYGPVIVVDDGSTDASGTAAGAAGATVLRHGKRLGKGAALIRGADAALARGATAVVTIDGDGQHDSDEIPLLLDAARENGRAVVIGGRLRGSHVIPQARMNAINVAGFFINWLTGTSVFDTQSGFRLYPADLFRRVTPRHGGFVLETELLLAARREGFALREIAVTAIHHEHRRSRFRAIRDGCAIGWFLARNVLARGWRDLRDAARTLAEPFTPPVARERHRELALETLPYRDSWARFSLAFGGFTMRRVAITLGDWWSHPRARQARLLGVAILVFPLLCLLTLLHPLLSWAAVDLLTPLVRRCYSQERLAEAQRHFGGAPRVGVGHTTG